MFQAKKLEPGWATVSCPGSCGELVQGVWKGRPFLITCPVNLYSTVTVQVLPGPSRIRVYPQEKDKVRRAVEKAVEYLDLPPLQAEVMVTSDIPVGKGMASSTADITAAIAATAMASMRHLGSADIARLAVTVEPTDGTFLPGIAMFDHLGASLMRTLGYPPPMQLLVLDLGGEVDTVAFNHRPDLWPGYLARTRVTAKALGLVFRGLKQGDCNQVAQGATLSALSHQDVLPKAGLTHILNWALSRGAGGLNVAHSGTVVGVIFGNHVNPASFDETARLVTNSFPQVNNAYTLKVVGGGLEAVDRGFGIRASTRQ